MPDVAALPVAIATTSGIARPSACGQAITRTVIVRTMASSGMPSAVQTTAVSTAAANANQKSHAANRSASSCAREVEFCASETSRWMPASAVSPPTAVTRIRSAESVATVPAVTASPTVFVTARGLAGDHRLVERRSAVEDATVRRHGRPRSHEDRVADPEVGGSDRDGRRALDALGGVGEECGEGIEGGSRLREGAHLEPVAEEHDDDEEGEFPPEVERVVEDAERGSPGCEERDRDREGDEQHHARRARTELRPSPTRNGRPPHTKITVPSRGETTPRAGTSGRR